jgi:hypothetical protein
MGKNSGSTVGRYCLLALLLLPVCGAASEHVARPGDVIVTDFYRVEVSNSGALNIYSLTGEQLAADFPTVQADYFSDGVHAILSTERQTTLRVESGESGTGLGEWTRVSATANLGPATNTWTCLLSSASPYIECRVCLKYDRPVDSVFSECVTFRALTDSADAVMRDLRTEHLGKYIRHALADQWTTRAVRFGTGLGSFTLTGEDNALALRVGWDSSEGDWRVTYDLDRDMDHPKFRGYGWAHGRPFYDTVATTGRRKDDTRRDSFRLAVGAPQRTLKRERSPNGFEAALVMTEHADCEGPGTTWAIANGSSESRVPIPGRGILGNGLTWTKSVFRWSTAGTYYEKLGLYGLDSARFKEAVDSLYAHGVEIALHTATAVADSARITAVALRDLTRWYHSRVWIDHGCDVNPEALASFGAVPESTAWFIADTLAEYGWNYCWLAVDISGLGIWGQSNLGPGSLERYPPVLYPMPGWTPRVGRSPLYLWGTYAIQSDQHLDSRLSPAGIQQTLSERGVTILHMYFGAQDTYVGRPRPAQAKWLVPHGSYPDMTWETSAKVDHYFQSIAQQQKAGRLWVTTLSKLADYLLLADSVEITALSQDEFQLVNRAHCPIPGFALSTAARGVRRILKDGVPVESCKRVAKDLLFWFDMPAQGTATIRIEGDEPSLLEARSGPVRHNVDLEWQSPERGRFKLGVYDLSGRLVQTLAQGWSGVGTHHVQWNCHDAAGLPVRSGTYICHLQVGSSSASWKVVVLD